MGFNRLFSAASVFAPVPVRNATGWVFARSFRVNPIAVALYQLDEILCREWRKVENANVRSGAG
jgi:hypothetical protein